MFMLWKRYTFVIFLILGCKVSGHWDDFINFGAIIVPTQGEPWPMVAERTVINEYLYLQSSTFTIELNKNCDILLDASERYKKIILTNAEIGQNREATTSVFANIDPEYKGWFTTLAINVTGSCENTPYLHMNESYELIINDTAVNLNAKTIWGALRGLETFSQLLIPTIESNNLMIKIQTIIDKPILPHRGLLLDTSRHYIEISDILLTLDAMSYNKLNVFHWHITDDNSFPYQSTTFPELSEKGAWHPSMIYTVDNVKEIIEYARLRGIRVIPEFDTPGHVQSWGFSHPELLTSCYDISGKANGKRGPLNPTNPEIWPFLRTFYAEILNLFIDQYVHLGGDEVNFDCWHSNLAIRNYMQAHGMGNDFASLEAAYIKELLMIPARHNVSSIVWQEVLDNGVQIASDTVVQVWKDSRNWPSKLSQITRAGHPVILSACWYLDDLARGGDWEKYYNCNPLNFDGVSSAEDLMLGGEACMWAEFIDKNNIHSRIWPRASATAERLWSKNIANMDEVKRRLEEHTCRMNKRKIPAQPPNGADYCVSQSPNSARHYFESTEFKIIVGLLVVVFIQ